jgi:hypothetical protein
MVGRHFNHGRQGRVEASDLIQDVLVNACHRPGGGTITFIAIGPNPWPFDRPIASR